MLIQNLTLEKELVELAFERGVLFFGGDETLTDTLRVPDIFESNAVYDNARAPETMVLTLAWLQQNAKKYSNEIIELSQPRRFFSNKKPRFWGATRFFEIKEPHAWREALNEAEIFFIVETANGGLENIYRVRKSTTYILFPLGYVAEFSTDEKTPRFVWLPPEELPQDKLFEKLSAADVDKIISKVRKKIIKEFYE